jgi:hypothetical protein
VPSQLCRFSSTIAWCKVVVAARDLEGQNYTLQHTHAHTTVATAGGGWKRLGSLTRQNARTASKGEDLCPSLCVRSWVAVE